MQTAWIDQQAGLIRLTTVLAHSTGEWVSSDLPVCPVGEIAAPARWGSAHLCPTKVQIRHCGDSIDALSSYTILGLVGELLEHRDSPAIRQRLQKAEADLEKRRDELGHSQRGGAFCGQGGRRQAAPLGDAPLGPPRG